MNVREELRRLRRNPLDPLLRHLGYDSRIFMGPNFTVITTDLDYCAVAYDLYYRSLARLLPEISVTRRWWLGLESARLYRKAYTPAQTRIAKRHREVAPFLELDVFNCVIHARILLDRVAALSSHFLRVRDLPIRSFHAHRGFFTKLKGPFGAHEDYARKMREATWFDDLREIRDKFLVHSGPPFMRILSKQPEEDPGLVLVRRERPGSAPGWEIYFIGIPQLARQIDAFLCWFGEYGLRSLERTSDA